MHTEYLESSHTTSPLKPTDQVASEQPPPGIGLRFDLALESVMSRAQLLAGFSFYDLHPYLSQPHRI